MKRAECRVSGVDETKTRRNAMSRDRVEEFGPYQDAVKLFDLVVEDMAILQKDSRCYRLVGQQIASADSICSNNETRR